MQITLDIANKQTAEHILWMLNRFKKDGVKIHKVDTVTPKSKLQDKNYNNTTTEQYLKLHWKILLLQGVSDPDYYKSSRFKSDKANFLMEKYK